MGPLFRFTEPILENGKVFTNSNKKDIRIDRILAQDEEKSVHQESKTYVDLNRAVVVLMEKDFRVGSSVICSMKKKRQILRYIGSYDSGMEKGSLRCDTNVSVRPKSSSWHSS